MPFSTKNGLSILVPALALLGFAGLLYSTPGGIGLHPDSVVYIGVARNLLRGDGITFFDDAGDIAAVTHYPPLFPMTIAAVGCSLTRPTSSTYIRIGAQI